MKCVFDLDGTLSFDYMTINEEVKQVLQSADKYGHEVIFASARSYRDCLGLLGDQLGQNLVIGLNGGLIYQGGQLLFERRLDERGYQSVLDWCQTYNLPLFVDNTFHYSGQIVEKIPFIASVDPLKRAKHLALADLINPIKVVVYMGDHEFLVEEMQHQLSSLQVMDISYHEHEKCLYINPLHTNKATTILEQCGHEFIAFGNDKNDIEMFKASTYAVQIGDYPGLREFADDCLLLTGDYQAALAAKITQVFADFRGR